jgi:hypothetical protein
MNPKPVTLVVALLLSSSSFLIAQTKPALPDTASIRHQADATLKAMSAGMPKSVIGTGMKRSADSTHHKSDLINGIPGKSISFPTFGNLSFDLSAESAGRLNPAPVVVSNTPFRKFQAVFSLRGTVNAFGIPLMLDLSSDPLSGRQFSPQSLYKFNYNPKLTGSLLQSDLDRYYSLRRSAFAGLDITSYTRNLLYSQLTPVKAGIIDKQSTLLSAYITDPDTLNSLLLLNRTQIKDKLKAAVNLQAPAKQLGLSGENGYPTGIINGITNKKLSLPATLTENEWRQLGDDKQLSAYVDDPVNQKKLRNMNEVQIREQLQNYISNYVPTVTLLPSDPRGMDATYAVGLRALLDSVAVGQKRARETVVKNTARSLFLELRQNDQVSLASVVKQNLPAGPSMTELKKNSVPGSAMLRQKTETENTIAGEGRIDSMATTIAALGTSLQRKGYDMRKILKMQQFLNNNNLDVSSSEFVNGMLAKKPGNGLQSLFSNVGQLEAGAYGVRTPTATNGQEIFVNGTHLTLNTGYSPVTVGYGSVSDISSFKDEGFQNSAFNKPRSVTYIGAEFKRVYMGSFRISAISSFNRQFRSELYSVPTISSNNVALTMSKELKLGKVGDFGIDVSKSTTVYNNRFQVGSEAILDKLGGLDYNLNNSLFSAFSFGFNHHLDVPGLDAGENVYFSYAGMGYQNPGNNGFGGARTRFGGNVRKLFYHRRLNISIRTDMSNMPISYTSNDQWKTHLVQVDSRFQVSKKLNISFKFMDNGTNKRVDNFSSPIYGMQKLQFGANSNYKIGKYFSVSHVDIGIENFSSTYAGKGNLLMIDYTQTVIMKKNSFSASLFYNKEMASYQLIGNMLNSDITYQYRLFDKIGLSSGLTYLNNGKTANQAGIRQTVQLMSLASFEVDAFVDVRKNLTRPVFADLYPTSRAELSLTYHIRN